MWLRGKKGIPVDLSTSKLGCATSSVTYRTALSMEFIGYFPDFINQLIFNLGLHLFSRFPINLTIYTDDSGNSPHYYALNQLRIDDGLMSVFITDTTEDWRLQLKAEPEKFLLLSFSKLNWCSLAARKEWTSWRDIDPTYSQLWKPYSRLSSERESHQRDRWSNYKQHK